VGLSVADAPVFGALGDPNRLRMVIALCEDGPSPTSALSRMLPSTRQAATKHLEVLSAAGVVTSARRGRERIWAVRPESLTGLADQLRVLSRRWDARLDRLRDYVED
jgi:DNA-binding transcriptional ArsR family regulator